MLFELVFDIVLTEASVANRPFYEFTLREPTFRRRVQDVRFTRANAWLTIQIEGAEEALAEYERAFGRGPGTLAIESRRIAVAPGFRLFYEKQREPTSDDEETIWHLVALDVGTDARITYDTRHGASRVTVAHEDRERLAVFYRRLVRLDAYGEVRFVRVGPVASSAEPRLARDDRRLLVAAWTAGYYERPRRTDLRALAAKLDLSLSTLGWRLRGLEREAMERLVRAQDDAFGSDLRAGDGALREPAAPAARARGPSPAKAARDAKPGKAGKTVKATKATKAAKAAKTVKPAKPPGRAPPTQSRPPGRRARGT